MARLGQRRAETTSAHHPRLQRFILQQSNAVRGRSTAPGAHATPHHRERKHLIVQQSQSYRRCSECDRNLQATCSKLPCHPDEILFLKTHGRTCPCAPHNTARRSRPTYWLCYGNGVVNNAKYAAICSLSRRRQVNRAYGSMGGAESLFSELIAFKLIKITECNARSYICATTVSLNKYRSQKHFENTFFSWRRSRQRMGKESEQLCMHA